MQSYIFFSYPLCFSPHFSLFSFIFYLFLFTFFLFLCIFARQLQNHMKSSRFIILSAALLLTACGSHYKVRYEQRPVPPATIVTPKPVATVPAPVVHKEIDWRTPLQKRIDNLLQADATVQTAQVAVCVFDITANQVLYEYGSQQRLRPASTEKAFTAIAALDLLGPDYELRTRVCSTGTLSGGTLRGDLWVVGAMDPLLTYADLQQLARRLKALGIHRIEGRICEDLSFKDTDKWGWGWCWDDENPTLTPLLCGGKDNFHDRLTAALRAAGITGAALNRRPTVGNLPTAATEQVAVTHTLAEVLVPMLKDSNNLCAESVFYQIASAMGGRHASRKQAAQYMQDLLIRCGGRNDLSTVADGSGLSLYNYQTAANFVSLLAYASRSERILPALWNALPVAAVDGTLKTRMADTPAAANVHAKTGSVSAVSTLVGYTTQRSTTHLIAFAILTQGVVHMAEGRNLQDRICEALSE